jgi:DNA end-binding protein Ku
MARALWKGAISFGLVHIPVALVSATSAQGVDFDWLDRRSMQPVGYKRINKVSGEEVGKEDIVKGVEIEKGRYVVISEEEIRAAHPKSTQTIDIFAFVERAQIPLTHFDKPYYLAPDKRGEKVYALLRETLRTTDKVALARVVLHSKQHLTALMPLEDAMVLVMLRWPAEVRGLDSLELDAKVSDVELAKGELAMAKRLVEDMVAPWQPEEYQDTFTEKIMQLVDEKARKGKIEDIEAPADEQKRASADIYDLTELLKRSLSGGKGQAAGADGEASAKPGKASRKKSTKSANR